MLKAHMLRAESNSREGKPADLSDLYLRWLRDLSKRKLTALIAPSATFYDVDSPALRVKAAIFLALICALRDLWAPVFGA